MLQHCVIIDLVFLTIVLLGIANPTLDVNDKINALVLITYNKVCLIFHGLRHTPEKATSC